MKINLILNKGMVSCQVCKKKLNKLMIELYTCRCGGVYCRTHMFEEHTCSFDYQKQAREQIARQNPQIQPEKIKT